MNLTLYFKFKAASFQQGARSRCEENADDPKMFQTWNIKTDARKIEENGDSDSARFRQIVQFAGVYVPSNCENCILEHISDSM